MGHMAETASNEPSSVNVLLRGRRARADMQTLSLKYVFAK